MLKDWLQGKPLRHPLHPLLVHLPLGFFMFSAVLDLASWIFRGEPALVRGAYYFIGMGVITAALAAVPGFVDYTDIRRDRPAKKLAVAHMAVNLAAVAIYAVNLGMRSVDLSQSSTPIVPLVMSVASMGLLSVGGYLGGKMIFDNGIAVGRHRRWTETPEETLQRSTASATMPGSVDSHRVLVRVAALARIGDGETIRVNIDGQIIAVVRLDGQVYAFQDFCTHRHGPLSEGSFHGGHVECPWHRSCFDVRTGKVVRGPAKLDLKTFDVEMREGEIFIRVTRKIEPFQPSSDASVREAA